MAGIFSSINYFLEMVLMDSVINAVNFVVIYLNQNLTDKQIVTASNSLYSGSLIDRYIYYLLVYTVYNILCAFFWVNDINVLYYFGLLTIIPPFINKIFRSSFFKTIRKQKELIIKLFFAKILSVIMKFFSKTYLQKKIKNFKYTELLYLLSDYQQTVNYFYIVLKNFGIILLLSYIKKYSTQTYYDIIKYIYGYKTGELLNSFNESSGKDYLIKIIDNKNWVEFTKPNTYNAILKVYQLSPKDVDIFDILSAEISFIVAKIFSMWTIASLFGNVLYVPLLSLVLALYKYIRVGKGSIREMCVIIGVIPLCYICDWYVVIGFLCQCMHKMMFNKLTYKIYKEFKGKCVDVVEYIGNMDKNIFISMGSIICYLGIIKIFNLYDILLILNVLFNMIYFNNERKNLLNCVIVCSTYLSNYNLIHIIINTCLVFVLDYNIGHMDIGNKVSKYVMVKYNKNKHKIIIVNKLLWNIGGKIFRRNDIDYTLIDELLDDGSNKNIIIEDFMLNNSVDNNIKDIVVKNNTYNIIDTGNVKIIKDYY